MPPFGIRTVQVRTRREARFAHKAEDA